MLRAFCLVLLLAPALSSSAQPATDSLAASYRVYDGDGQPASLGDVLAAMEAVEVVFVGEQHDDPVAHHLQHELLMRAFAQHAAAGRPVALSLEMFQRDVQPILDEYLADAITERHFLRSSRPWNNYDSDYAPLVTFARAHRLPVIAANAPRRYVNRVSRLGPGSLDALSAWAKSWLPPLPYPGATPAYAAKWNAMMAEMSARHGAPHGAAPHGADTTAALPPGHPPVSPDSARVAETHARPAAPPTHGPGYALDAQALWDASMAYSLAQHLMAAPDALVLHMAGSFHVEGGLGTPAQLVRYRPGTRHLVVVVKPVDDIGAFDAETMAGLGDFVILSDASLPRTFEPSFE